MNVSDTENPLIGCLPRFVARKPEPPNSGNGIAEILSSFLAFGCCASGTRSVRTASVEGLLQSLTAGCDPSLHKRGSRPVPLLGRPAVSTQVDDNLATLAEVRLSAGEPRLEELERGYGLARGPHPINSAVSGVARSTHTFEP
jgi:hypothetical protein